MSKNIETIVLSNQSAIGRIFDTSGIIGATNYKLDSNDQAFSITDLATTGITLHISHANSAKTVQTLYASTVTVANNDLLSVKLNDVGTLKTHTVAEAALSLAEHRALNA